MSKNIDWFTSLVADQVTFLTRGVLALALLGVGIPIAGALSEDSAGLGIFIVAVSVSSFALVGLTGAMQRLQLLSKSIPEEVKDNPSSKGFQSQPWAVFMVLIVAVIVGMNVGFGLILL